MFSVCSPWLTPFPLCLIAPPLLVHSLYPGSDKQGQPAVKRRLLPRRFRRQRKQLRASVGFPSVAVQGLVVEHKAITSAPPLPCICLGTSSSCPVQGCMPKPHSTSPSPQSLTNFRKISSQRSPAWLLPTAQSTYLPHNNPHLVGPTSTRSRAVSFYSPPQGRRTKPGDLI